MTGKHWIGKDLDGRGRDLTRYYLRHLPESTEKNHERSVKVANVQAEICKWAPPKQQRIAAVVYEAHAYCNLSISAQYFRNHSNR
jgi:hypothetical protein